MGNKGVLEVGEVICVFGERKVGVFGASIGLNSQRSVK